MERPVPESLLLKFIDGKRYLTDENIFGMMVDWHWNIRRESSEKENYAWADRVAATLAAMNSRLQKEIENRNLFNPCVSPMPLSDFFLIVSSFGVIAETVEHTAGLSFRLGSIFEEKKCSWNFVNKFAIPQMRSMVSKGWCPFTLQILLEGGACGFAYACTIAPFQRADFDHRTGCTFTTCKINNIDTNSYVRQHVDKLCKCANIKPPLHKIQELLLKGEIPVILYNSTTCEITVESSADGAHVRPYIAISHVWVDGMGSRTEDGLPACQLQRLAQSARDLRRALATCTARDSHSIPAKRTSLHSHSKLERLVKTDPQRSNLRFHSGWKLAKRGAARRSRPKLQRLRETKSSARRSSANLKLPEPWDIAFWIDSLCVPDERLSKKKAIGLMTRTYEEATGTLVVDTGIRACSQRAPKAEQSLRIATSNWMQRLWTLQEGFLAKNLAFEFRDGFTFMSRDIVPLGADSLDTKRAYFMWMITPLSPCGPTTLRDIISSICWRSTSKAKDETVAIAGLVGVKAAELLQYHDRGQRMKEFFLRLRQVPADIIFLGGPKLTERGFRWAPMTLMTHSRLNVMSITGAIAEADGLLAEYPCMALRSCIVIEKDTGSEYMLEDRKKKRAFRLKNEYDVKPNKRFNLLLVRKLPDEEEEEITCAGVMSTGSESGRTVCDFSGSRFSLKSVPMAQALKIKVGTDGFPIKRIYGVIGKIPVKLV